MEKSKFSLSTSVNNILAHSHICYEEFLYHIISFINSLPRKHGFPEKEINAQNIYFITSNSNTHL